MSYEYFSKLIFLIIINYIFSKRINFTFTCRYFIFIELEFPCEIY